MMITKLRKAPFTGLMATALLFGSPPGISQTVAYVSQKEAQEQRVGTQAVQLKNVLNLLKSNYRVDIMFELKSVEGLTVPANVINMEQSLERNLDKVLTPFGLTFKKVNRQSYLVLDDKKRNKPTSRVIPEPGEPLQDLTNRTYLQVPAQQRIFEEPPSPERAVVVDRQVSGKVTDENGIGLPGVSILLKGTQQGTTTDSEGAFTIEAPDKNAILVFSFVGYVSQEVAAGSRTRLEISLKVDEKSLEEVVVVGYGTVNKSDLTGSVAKLKMEGSEELPITSVEQMLQGRVAGVQITQNTGAPGGGITFLVRGANSVSGTNEPLVVIDGYPVESGNTVPSEGYTDAFSDTPGNNALANLNPNDIESVEILKDASATAIYGSRGANGVVLITTKRGQAGRERIEYNFRFDLSQIPRRIPVLNTNEFITYANEAAANDGVSPVYNESRIAELSKTDFNWQDLVYRTARTQQHQLSISGGDEKLRYMIAANYLNQEGVVRNSGYERGVIRANIDRQVNRRLKIGMNFNGTLSKSTAMPQSTANGNIGGSVVLGALFSTPLRQPYDENEDPDLTYSGNPLTLLTLFKDHTRDRTILVNLFADFEILKGLKFRVNGGVNDRGSTRETYSPRGTWSGDTYQGQAFRGENRAFNYLTEYTLNYSRTFSGKHRINAVAGYTWQEWNSKRFGVLVQQFPNDNLSYYNMQSGNAIGRPNSSTQEWALASWLGRFNYSFDNRYLFTFTGRTDGSTRLSEGNKWDFFPSVALGWNVHNERFMETVPVISELKLRASYGVSGNQSIGVGSTKARLNTLSGVIGQSVVIGYTQASMANNNLGWERTSQVNIGADIGLLKNRLLLGIEFYKKRSTDLLLDLPIPPSTGLSTYATNVGEVENKGMELEFSSRILTNRLKWEASGNISFNRNKVISLGDLSEIRGRGFGVSTMNRSLHVARPGLPIGVFNGFKNIGVYQTQEEIDAGPKDPVRPTPGDYRYADVSGPDGVPDGQIDEHDLTIIGNPNPDYFFGLSNNFSWKGISFSFLVQGSIGQDVINLNRHRLDALNGSPSQSSKEAWENRWTGQGTSTRYAKATLTGTNFSDRFSDFIVEDGSYVRLKNIMIGYDIPLGKIGFIRSVKLFATATNILTFTRYKGYDPEINSKGQSALTPGVDYGSIPQVKVYSFGINAGFR